MLLRNYKDCANFQEISRKARDDGADGDDGDKGPGDGIICGVAAIVIHGYAVCSNRG
jgi:hypothetical protein